MEWSEGDLWVAEVGAASPAGAAVEYKYIVREGERALDWSQVREKDETGTSLSRQERTSTHFLSFFFQGDNFPLPLPPGATLTVADAWDGARHEVVVEELGVGVIEERGEVEEAEGGPARTDLALEEAEEEAADGPIATAALAAPSAAEEEEAEGGPELDLAASVAAAELSAALAASAEAVALLGPASRAALDADARVAAAEAAVTAASARE